MDKAKGPNADRSIANLQVSLSSAVMPMVKMVPRGFTAAADAYLTPGILRCAPLETLSAN